MVFIRFSLVTFLSLLLTVGTAQALQVECSGGQLDLKVEGLGSLVSIDRNELSSRRGRRSAVKTLSKYMLRNSRRALQTRRAFRKAKRKMRKKLNRVVKRCMRREGTFGLRPDRLGLRANSSCSAEAPSIVRYTELLDQSQTDGFTFKATIGNFGSKPAFPGAPGIYALIRGSGSTPFPLTHMEYAHTPVNEGEEITAQIGALGNAVEAEVIIAQFCDNEVFYSAPLAVTAQPDKALNPADFAHFPRAAVLRTEISTFTPRTTIEGTIPVDASLAAELDSGAKTFVARNATSGEVFPVDYEPIAFQTAEDGSRLPSIYQLALATHGFPGIEAFEILPVPNSLVERHRTPFQTTPHITDFLSNGRIRAVFEGPAANYRAQFDMSQCTERVFDGDRLQVYSCSKKVQTDDNRYPANMVVTIFVRVFSGLNFVSLEGVLANSNQLGVSNIIVNRGYLRANIGSRQLTFGIRSLQENGRELYRHGLSYDGTRYDLIKQISAAQNHVIPQDHLMPWDGVAIHLNEESRELADAYLENYRPAVAGCEAQSLESLGQNFLLQRPLGMAVVGDPQTFFSQPELQAIANDVFNIHAPITDVYESSNPKMVYSVHPEFYTYFTGYRQLSGGSGNGLELTSPLLTLACGLRSEGLGRVLDAASFRLKAFQSRLVTSAAYYGSEKNTLPNFESHATQNWNFGGLFRFHIPFERASEYNPNDQLIDDYPALHPMIEQYRSTVPYFEDVAPYLRGSYWQHPWSSVDDRHSLRAHTAINVEPYLLPSFATRLIGELSSEVYLIASRRKSGSTSEQGHTIDHMMELAQMNPGSQTIINRRGSSLGFLIPALINHREIPQYIQERVELQMQALLISAGSNSEVLLNERDLDGRDLTEAGLLGLLRAINSTITAVDPQHLADDLSRAAHNARVAYYSARFKPRHLSAWEANFTTSMYMPIERLTRHHSAFQGTNMDFRAMIARHVEKVTVRCEGSMPIGSCGIASLQRQQQDGTFGLWVIPFSIQTDPNDPNTRRQLPEWMSHQFAKTADAATTYGLTVHAVQALEYALPTTTAQLFTLYSQHGNFSMTGDKLLGSASNGFRYSETQAWHSFPIAAVQREIGLLQ